MTPLSPRFIVAAVFLTIAPLYVLPLFVTDPSLRWAEQDEVCCHVPTIRAIRDEGLATAVTDYKRYRTATAPFYHLLMSLVLDRVEPIALRAGWGIITLVVAILLYRHIRTDPALDRAPRAAVALAVTFLLSPTVRASALYFITDGLAVHLAIVALVLLRRASSGARFSMTWGILAASVAYASFYTRQYYLWAPVYVACCVFANASNHRAKIATASACLVLTVPAAVLFAIWHGFTPPLDWPLHTTPVLLSTVPNALGLVALYALPLLWVAIIDNLTVFPKLSTVAAGMILFVAAGLLLGFEIPHAGGILRILGVFGSFGAVVFLALSFLGLVLLLRWLILDGPRQLVWGVFLLPLLTGSILLQRYFEPAILVILFLAARPADALRALDSRLVLFYPTFAAIYAFGRMIYVAPNL